MDGRLFEVVTYLNVEVKLKTDGGCGGRERENNNNKAIGGFVCPAQPVSSL